MFHQVNFYEIRVSILCQSGLANKEEVLNWSDSRNKSVVSKNGYLQLPIESRYDRNKATYM